MGLRITSCLFLILGLCTRGAAGQNTMDYQRDIQPLFDRYCVACHACFDAPCQLVLTHPAGVLRGASKQPVYDGTRLEPVPPTRLFIDGRSTDDWRRLGFFPVTEAPDADPVLLRLLDLKAAHPLPPDHPIPDGVETGIPRHNHCADAQEIGALTAARPHLGMPFVLPGMPAEDLERIRAWLDQGGPVKQEQPVPSASEKVQVARWEQWLNQRQPRRVLLARWLFEHWTIARLYFDGGENGLFFRLVRSATPPGETVDEIATRFPNSDPGRPFYYRLLPLSGTRVYKTHITFALDNDLLRRINRLFYASDWAVADLPGYSEQERSNPFETFAPIPAAARYRFMLEHAEYFVRTFIRGPVCRGQLATDVIRDHFWVMFQAPDSDPYIVDSQFRRQADPLLDLPNVEDALLLGAQTWFESTRARNRYTALRQKTLAARQPKGADLASIWDGDSRNTNALLTVFRHHDSATVKRGWLGQRPFTLWWMDYPLLERSYYNLVVNFDVFGNLAHQAQTRLYFDLIRNGAEQNFLRLLPASARQAILDRWYAGSGKIKLWLSYQSINTDHASGITYQTAKSKTELLDRLLRRFSQINATPDPINRPQGKFAARSDALLSPLSTAPAADMPAIDHLPEATILRIAYPDGHYNIYTLIRNRRHSNVAFILGESLRYEPKKDTLTVAPGVATAYPNFLFNIPIGELPQFVTTLSDKALGERSAFVKRLVDRWGIRRSSPDFWSRFHDVNRYLANTTPLQAGVLDLNRYVDFRPRDGIDLDL